MSRFRLRDPSDLEKIMSFNQDSVTGSSVHVQSDYSSSSSSPSSVSSDEDVVDSDLQSMTAKGISHLCSELMELKNEADEDFQKSIFSNYSAFLKAFEEMEGLESELLQLKHQTSMQKQLTKVLMERLSVNDLAEQLVESILDEDSDSEQFLPSILESHTQDVSEIMDNLISEHRLDEAQLALEMEARAFQSMDFGRKFTSDDLMSYKSAISEKRAMLVDQLALVAENPRVSAPELQKALVRLCKLGQGHLATRLLINYYHTRITRGIHELHSSKFSLRELYIREVAKLVFSMISQAEKSFVALHGEASSYGPELAEWAIEETESFATCLDEYILSIKEITDGLSSAVEAVQLALSYCSLLESQKVTVRECLLNNLRPTLDQVLQLHIDHYKKVINIFTVTDTWVLGRFLVSGILSKEDSFENDHTKPEYCLLTNSGRKFITLFQAVTNDSLPLAPLQMEASICRGLTELFADYNMMLEKALNSFTREEDGSEINYATSLVQGVSILANSSTLVQLFFEIVGSIRGDITHMKFELDDYVPFIQAAHNRLRLHFFEQVILQYFPPESDQTHVPESFTTLQDDQDVSCLLPSAPYQEFFLHLRKVHKFAEDSFIQQEWLVELLRELMEAIFGSISGKDQQTQKSLIYVNQCILDIHFLEEIARCGGYWSDNITSATSEVVNHIESSLISPELALEREENWPKWAKDSAKVAFQKLEELAEKESATNETSNFSEEETNEYESQNSSDMFKDDDDDATISSKQSPDSSPLTGSPNLNTPYAVVTHSFEENNLRTEGEGTDTGNPTNSVLETCLTRGHVTEVTEEESVGPLDFHDNVTSVQEGSRINYHEAEGTAGDDTVTWP